MNYQAQLALFLAGTGATAILEYGTGWWTEKSARFLLWSNFLFVAFLWVMSYLLVWSLS